LEETNNNLDDAKVWLKKKGFKEAENKMTRSANTKLYGMKIVEGKLCLGSLSCETDFVSGTDLFKNYLVDLINTLGEKNLQKISQEDLANVKTGDNSSLLDTLKNLIAKTQENCKIGVCESYDYSANNLIVGLYLHNSPVGYPSLGQKASIVVLHSEKITNLSDKKALQDLADSLAMQVVALNAKYLNSSDIPLDVLQHETNIFKEGLTNDGKASNPDTFEKILKNKINSWYEEIVLNEQYFVIVDQDSSEGKIKVQGLVSKRGKELGLDDLSIREFKLFL
jgi:elongation factor Ts